MRDALMTYFAGERNAGLFVAAVGAAVLCAGAALFPARLELRSLAWALLVSGLLQLALGVGLAAKTGPQVARLAAQLGEAPPAFYAAERPRMVIVQRNFVYVEALWTALLLGGALAAIACKRRFALSGAALGVVLTAAVLLVFDLVAERRGARYLAALEAGAAGGPPADPRPPR